MKFTIELQDFKASSGAYIDNQNCPLAAAARRQLNLEGVDVRVGRIDKPLGPIVGWISPGFHYTSFVAAITDWEKGKEHIFVTEFTPA
jgi:hypothetical protein